jgi:hypothetical protein
MMDDDFKHVTSLMKRPTNLLIRQWAYSQFSRYKLIGAHVSVFVTICSHGLVGFGGVLEHYDTRESTYFSIPW